MRARSGEGGVDCGSGQRVKQLRMQRNLLKGFAKTVDHSAGGDGGPGELVEGAPVPTHSPVPRGGMGQGCSDKPLYPWRTTLFDLIAKTRCFAVTKDPDAEENVVPVHCQRISDIAVIPLWRRDLQEETLDLTVAPDAVHREGRLVRSPSGDRHAVEMVECVLAGFSKQFMQDALAFHPLLLLDERVRDPVHRDYQ